MNIQIFWEEDNYLKNQYFIKCHSEANTTKNVQAGYAQYLIIERNNDSLAGHLSHVLS